jgi:hypothetical protein
MATQPSLLIAPEGNVSDVLMLDIADNEIQTIRIVRNPDKLRHLQAQKEGAGRVTLTRVDALRNRHIPGGPK